ncbi:MAG: hypothetical protein FH748_09270 [Balneolaceae bacterium]|nr:hypothetical protein [Balneolaceae bacterium]
MKKFIGLTAFIFLLLLTNGEATAQNRQLQSSQQFRLGERMIRIAEPGMLTDSVNVWGDVGSAGRYLVPKGTTLPLLLTYSFGPRTLGGETQLDWSKMRIEVNVNKELENGEMTYEQFKYRFEEPFPEGMYDYTLSNNETVTVRVKRKPSFRDYVGVVAPVISAIATSIIIVDRLAN